MKTDAFFSRWEIVNRFAKSGKYSLILPREQPADIKVPLVALEAAVGEIVAQPAQFRPNLLHRHHFRVEIDCEVLQVRAAHGVIAISQHTDASFLYECLSVQLQIAGSEGFRKEKLPNADLQ